MPNTIQIKRSSTASAVPSAAGLAAGELAINTADGKLFAKNSAGTVVNLPVASISGETITPGKVTATSGAGFGTSADPATHGSGCRLLVYGDTFLGASANGLGINVSPAYTWDNPVNTPTIVGVNAVATAYNPILLTAGYRPQLYLGTDGKIGVNTADPQAGFQILGGYGDDTGSPTPSTLTGTAQSEVLQVLHGGYAYDAENEIYATDEYVNLARFHVNNNASRGSFSLSNSGTGAWENNVMQMFVHGTAYSPGYYGGNTSDAGCAMLVTQGAAIAKLQIGNYNSAPIEFFTNNTFRVAISSGGNFGVGTKTPSTPLHVVSTGSGEAEVARFRRQDSGNTDGAHLAIYADNTNDVVQLRSTGTTAGSFSFYSGNNERVTIATSGEMAINSNTVLHAGNYTNYVTKTLLVFSANQGQPPASNYATLDTRNSVAVLDFDAATDESTVFIGYVPLATVLTSGLKVRINWMATTATSGACVWGVQFERMNTDVDADSFATAATGTTTTNATSGIPNVTSITITTIDSVAAGEFFRLKVYRNASAVGDTMTGDAELISVAVEVP